MDMSATPSRSNPALRRVLAAVAVPVFAATILALAPSAASASPLITNGSFAATSATAVVNGTTYGTSINNTDLTGWSLGTCTSNCTAPASFDFLFLPNSYANGVDYQGTIIPMYSSGPGALVTGGVTYNAIGVDAANATYALNQTVTNLTVGDTYFLTFYQASTQANGGAETTSFTGHWAVSLGSQSLNSATMNNPYQGSTNWVQQTLAFTATSASETLSFLATSPSTGQPPFLLLADVSLAVPEPDSLVMLAAGLGGLLLLRRRLRA
jgi:hypothetical protein